MLLACHEGKKILFPVDFADISRKDKIIINNV